MPLPTTRHTMPDGGAARGQDPVLLHAPTRKSVACFGAVSLSNGKFVRSMCKQFDAVTCEAFLKQLQRHRARHTHDHRAGQCHLPPCQPVEAVAAEIPQGPHALVPAAIQPATGASRAGLEARSPVGHAHSVLCHVARIARGGRTMLRPLAQTQCCAPKTLRHYLRRYV
jgi:hypothetical protein